MVTLDTDTALKGLANNTSLYRRVLDKFVESYAECGTAMLGHLQAEEREQAERLAHTIKGLAGSIGSPLLAEQSALLEHSIREGVPTADCVPVAERFTQILEETIEACKVASASLG